jgi:hypothetical protein
MTTDKLLAFVFGVVFVVVLLCLAIFFPTPTETQWFVFRVVLALAAAGVGAVLPGLISVRAGGVIRAGGALALFVIVFWFNPPKLVSAPPKRSLNIPSLGKPYHMVATISASGNKIEKKTIPHPTSNGDDHHFYIDSASGNVNSHSDVCPVVEGGWELDTDPFPGFAYGMTDRDHVVKTGDKYWSVEALPAGCIRLYCDGRDGSSHVQIAQVFVREKRNMAVNSCNAPLKQEADITPGELKQLSFDVAKAVSDCESALIQGRVQLTDPTGATVFTQDLAVDKPEEVLDGSIRFQLHGSGLLDVEYRTPANRAFVRELRPLPAKF